MDKKVDMAGTISVPHDCDITLEVGIEPGPLELWASSTTRCGNVMSRFFTSTVDSVWVKFALHCLGT